MGLFGVVNEIYMRGEHLIGESGPTRRTEWPVAHSKKVFMWEALEIVAKARFPDESTEMDLFARAGGVYQGDVMFLIQASQKAEEIGFDASEWSGLPSRPGIGPSHEDDAKHALAVASFFKAMLPLADADIFDYMQSALPKLKTLPFTIRADAINEGRKRRLSEVAHWLTAKARDGHITTYAQDGGFGETEYMASSEWNQPDFMKTFVRHGYYNRTLAVDDGRESSLPRGPNGFGVWSAIFFDRDDIELELEIDGITYKSANVAEIDDLSPYLRHAVNVALALNFRAANANAVVDGRRVTRPSLENEIKSMWDADAMGGSLSDKMAERLSYIIRHPEMENGVPSQKSA